VDAARHRRRRDTSSPRTRPAVTPSLRAAAGVVSSSRPRSPPARRATFSLPPTAAGAPRRFRRRRDLLASSAARQLPARSGTAGARLLLSAVARGLGRSGARQQEAAALNGPNGPVVLAQHAK